MAVKKRKTSSSPQPARAPAPAPGVYDSLCQLLDQLDQPIAPRKQGPGRPAKNRADTSPVILHLYNSQIRWLDDYAAYLEACRPGNVRLSRVEIVRGLLLGLARHAIERDLTFSDDLQIHSELDLQYALAAALAKK